MQGLATDREFREPETRISPQRRAPPPKTKMGKSPVKTLFRWIAICSCFTGRQGPFSDILGEEMKASVLKNQEGCFSFVSALSP